MAAAGRWTTYSSSGSGGLLNLKYEDVYLKDYGVSAGGPCGFWALFLVLQSRTAAPSVGVWKLAEVYGGPGLALAGSRPGC